MRQTYQINVRGHLDPQWGEWFQPMVLEHLSSGDTALTGQVADQAELFGVLLKVRDLGLPLLAVKLLEGETVTST